MESSCRTEVFFITLGGPLAHESSGRDDKGEGGESRRERMLHGRGFYAVSSLPVIATLSFVISTGAQHSGEISVWMLLLGNVFRRSEADLSRSGEIGSSLLKVERSFPKNLKNSTPRDIC
jgi:hypothetical protein